MQEKEALFACCFQTESSSFRYSSEAHCQLHYRNDSDHRGSVHTARWRPKGCGRANAPTSDPNPAQKKWNFFHNGILLYEHNALSLQARSKIWCHLKYFVTLCGPLWPFVALCGSLWLFVTLCGSLALCGPLWLFVTLCDPLWLFGPLWSFVVLCGSLWFFVTLCGIKYENSWKSKMYSVPWLCGFVKVEKIPFCFELLN